MTSVDEAIEHINTHGSHHTDVIVSVIPTPSTDFGSRRWEMEKGRGQRGEGRGERGEGEGRGERGDINTHGSHHTDVIVSVSPTSVSVSPHDYFCKPLQSFLYAPITVCVSPHNCFCKPQQPFL